MRNLTRQCEFLAQMLEKTIRQAVPQEIHFLQKFDRARSAIAEVVDLPDRNREQLLMRLQKMEGNWPANEERVSSPISQSKR